MRFNIHEHTQQKVKVAQHIKIPYASERLYIIKTEYKAYSNIYNTLYQASFNKYTTYFFMKNNYIYYHKEKENRSAIFKLDILRGNHWVFDTSHLNHKLKEPDSILVETKNGRRYIITNDVDWTELQGCVAVIDATNGNNLYIESKQNNLYLEAFSPIANSVVPIVQVTKDQINVYMIDINTERLDTISWSLKDIKDLISLIINRSRSYGKTKETILQDNLTQIDKFSAGTPDYVYRADNKENVYLKTVKLDFELSVSGMAASYDFTGFQIRIGWDGNEITCSWSVKSGSSYNATYLIAKIKEASVGKVLPNRPRYSLNDQNISREIAKLSNRFYPHTVVIKDNYLSNILYSNTCGCLLSSSRGLGITTSKSRTVHYHNEAVVHNYKEYIVIMANLFTYNDRKIKRILLIDTKNELMGIWEVNKTEWDCESESIMYNWYYFDDCKKLIFISSNYESNCLFYIDIDKMSDIFKFQKEMNCEIQKYDNIKDVIKSYDIKKLIIKAITDYHRKKPREDSVKIIGHYVDESASKIYVVAKYILSEGKSIPEAAIRIYTGLFIGTIHKGDLTFNFYYYIIGTLEPSYKFSSLSKSNILKSKNNKIPDLLKIDLYNSNYLYRHGLKHNKAKNLDLAYDNNRFISLRYHRRSYRIIKEKQYVISSDISVVGSLFLIKYKYNDGKGIKDNEFMVIVRDLLLVGNMRR
jgi:hypothetical protein